jgi:hypothetical protein
MGKVTTHLRTASETARDFLESENVIRARFSAARVRGMALFVETPFRCFADPPKNWGYLGPEEIAVMPETILRACGGFFRLW